MLRSNIINGKCFRIREESAKHKHEKGLTEKRLMKAEFERSRLERELKQVLINIKNAEHDVQTCRKEQLEDKQRVEFLLREKNVIARSKETAHERVKRLNRELLLCGQGKKKIARELDTLTQTIDDLKNQIKDVEKERDRYSSAVQGLEQQVKYKI